MLQHHKTDDNQVVLDVNEALATLSLTAGIQAFPAQYE